MMKKHDFYEAVTLLWQSFLIGENYVMPFYYVP